MSQKTDFPQFPAYACQGDRIEWTAEGFDIVARLEYDTDHQATEDECYDPVAVERWRNDEWFFCGVVLSVSRNGVELSDHAASLWGIECNYSDTSNTYLSEVAQDLQGEALRVARAELVRIREALTA